MPKLNKQMAKAVSEAEGGFAVVDDGVYVGKLLKVTVSDQPGASGSHYWKTEFVLEDNEKFNGSHQFSNLSLSEKALWKMNEFFGAFGVPADTDTEELYGKKIRLKISTGTIQSGQRAGEKGNQVDKFLPLEPAEDEEETPF